MAKPETAADYYRAIALDVLGAVAVGTYAVVSFEGPPPVWAKALYLMGGLAGCAGSYFRRQYFPLICFAIAAAIAAHQLVSGLWIVK